MSQQEIKRTAEFIAAATRGFAPEAGIIRHGPGGLRRLHRRGLQPRIQGHSRLSRIDGRGPQGPADLRHGRRSPRGGHAGPLPLLRGLRHVAGHVPRARDEAARHPLPLRVERIGRHQHLVPHGRPDGHHRPHQPDAQPADRTQHGRIRPPLPRHARVLRSAVSSHAPRPSPSARASSCNTAYTSRRHGPHVRDAGRIPLLQGHRRRCGRHVHGA